MAVHRAYINKDMITWGRERQGLDVSAIATKLHVAEGAISDWESGDALPTFRQARGLASVLRIPFGYLYLTAVPELDLPLPDLRTVPGGGHATPSPDLLDLLNDVLLKQRWYSDYLEAEGADLNPFVGKFTPDDPPEEIAADVQASLAVDDEMRQQSASWTEFLTQFARKVEAQRILVMRSGIVGNNVYRKLNVAEFRGFAISDVMAPVIFINARDAVAARIFTLAHELAHLWMGVSGISHSSFDRDSSQTPVDIESRCDSVAAEILMPEGDFKSRWQDQVPVDHNIQSLASYYRVSTLAILRQARERDVLDEATYRLFVQSEISKQNGVRGGTGGDFYNNLLARNGNLFTTTLLAAVLQRQVSYREAAQLLAARPRNTVGECLGV